MIRLGVLCGMEAEARALGPWREHLDIAVRVSGARPDRTEAQARELVGMGARGLLSWGIAGGLVPGFACGRLIRPSVVLAPGGGRHEVDLDPGRDGLLVGSDEIVLTMAEKKGFRAATGGVAVDMQSHRVARVAAEAELRFGVIRAISDPAQCGLPRLAATALGEDGRPKAGAVALGLARWPGDLPKLIRAGRQSRRALETLAEVAPDAIEACLAALVPA